ncbi:hypothetical protein N9937_02155 [bacterium]|nr:hypothetical protein [bacterium]
MSIEVSLTRIDPKVDPLSNEVHQWVFGFTAEDSENKVSAYADAVIDVSKQPLKRYLDYTKEEVTILSEVCKLENNIQKSLGKMVSEKVKKLGGVHNFNLGLLKE